MVCVCIFVTKCYREQTDGTRSTNLGTHMHVEVRLLIFIQTANVLDLYFQGQIFELSVLGCSYVNISQWQIGQTLLLPTNRNSHMAFPLAYLHWFWPILKANVKVMHLATANISKMVTDRANVTISIKYVTYESPHKYVNCICNSVLQGVGAVHLQKFQLIQNGAACVVARKKKFDPIMSTIRDELHWLPVVQRIHCWFINISTLFICWFIEVYTAWLQRTSRICVWNALLTPNAIICDQLFAVNSLYHQPGKQPLDVVVLHTVVRHFECTTAWYSRPFFNV